MKMSNAKSATSLVLLLICTAGVASKKINKQYMASLMPDNAILVEAGAFNGVDTIEWARLLPNAQIHAFEPIPRLFNLVCQRTKWLPNVKCYKYALSDKNGEATFNIADNGASSSLLKPLLTEDGQWKTFDYVSFKDTITVPTITLDSWMSENNIERIDAMWLDLQGFEKQVLEASPRALESVKVIYTEMSINPSYDGVVLFNEYRTWLESRGFTLKWQGDPNRGHEVDVLFIKG